VNPETERGAVHTLELLPAQAIAEPIRQYARERMAAALQHHDQWREAIRNLDAGSERVKLLTDSLRDRAVREAVHVLRAIHALSDRETMAVALENVQSRDANQRANALETLESVREAQIIRPVLRVWEADSEAASTRDDGAGTRILEATLDDGDAWIRACAALAVGAGDPAPFRKKINGDGSKRFGWDGAR